MAVISASGRTYVAGNKEIRAETLLLLVWCNAGLVEHISRRTAQIIVPVAQTLIHVVTHAGDFWAEGRCRLVGIYII